MVGEQRYPRDREPGESERVKVSLSSQQFDQQNRESRVADEIGHVEPLVQHYTEDRESR